MRIASKKIQQPSLLGLQLPDLVEIAMSLTRLTDESSIYLVQSRHEDVTCLVLPSSFFPNVKNLASHSENPKTLGNSSALISQIICRGLMDAQIDWE
jgi:hypothetical protein